MWLFFVEWLELYRILLTFQKHLNVKLVLQWIQRKSVKFGNQNEEVNNKLKYLMKHWFELRI